MENTSIIVDKIIKSDKKKLLYLWIIKNNTFEASKIISEFSNGEKYSIEEIFSEFKIAYSNEVDIVKVNTQAREALNKPKCPTCSSTNISKISTMSKAGSVVMFGLLSQKVKKQFHCNNCSYEW